MLRLSKHHLQRRIDIGAIMKDTFFIRKKKLKVQLQYVGVDIQHSTTVSVKIKGKLRSLFCNKRTVILEN
jgi:cytochrome c-type biogenesis protein CcmE